jgi:hypothetical protein
LLELPQTEIGNFDLLSFLLAQNDASLLQQLDGISLTFSDFLDGKHSFSPLHKWIMRRTAAQTCDDEGR